MAQEERELPGALIIWGSFAEGGDSVSLSGLNRWWTFEHLPERLALPGFRRCRRYIAIDSAAAHPKYLVWYEVSTLSALASEEYMRVLNNPTEGTKHCVPALSRLNRSACCVLDSKYRPELGVVDKSVMVAGILLQVVIPAPRTTAARASLSRCSEDILSAYLLEDTTCVSFHVVEHDEAASRIGNASESYANTKLQDHENDTPIDERWMLLIELASTDALFAERAVSRALEERSVDVREVQSYQLICVLSRS